ESWDIAIGKNQTPLIQLGYEGVTVEHVLEKRLKARAFAGGATAVSALAAAEDCVLYLKSARLTEEIGEHAAGLLVQETRKPSAPVSDGPSTVGLLWSAEWLLGLRTVEAIREFFAGLLENRLALSSFPGYVNGFLLALKFTPLVARLVVELLSRAFEKLPDA